MNMRRMTRSSRTRAFAAKAAALAAMLVTTAADAAVYYVDKDYAGTEVGTDPDQPFNTIREAVDAAKANVGVDEIRIAAGTYDDAREQWSTLGQFDVSFTGTGTDGLTVRGGYGVLATGRRVRRGRRSSIWRERGRGPSITTIRATRTTTPCCLTASPSRTPTTPVTAARSTSMRPAVMTAR